MIVGRAEIVVTALKNKFRESLNDEFRGAEKDADKAGENVGSRFGRAAGVSGSKQFIEGFDTSPVAGHLGEAGDRGGASFGSRLAAKIKSLDTQIFGQLKTAGRDELGAAGDGGGDSFVSRLQAKLRTLDDSVLSRFGSAATRRLGSDGDESGRSWRNGFRRSVQDVEGDLAEAGDGAGKAFSRSISNYDLDLPSIGSLGLKIIALVPLVGVLGGALAALVGAATSMAAAFTFAAGSSAILATGLSALGAGLITGMLAMGGIGNALKAMTNAQANAGKEAVAAAKAQRSAARQVQAAHDAVAAAALRVQRAERELARAQRDVARQAVTDARAVQDAERKLADAQQAATLAQRGLTAAREDAKEKLEELQLQERGAVIGEEEATLRLRQARAAYTKTLNDSSATSDDKEQARLDLENAELALDQAKDTREDVTKQTNEANKAGIEGSKDVTDAKQKITDANRSVADAEQAVADARRKQADDAVDGAQRIADAQQSVADALHDQQRANERLKDAEDDARHAADDFSASAIRLKKAMDALSPSAQKFAKYLFSLQPVLKQLKDAAGAELFGPLTIAIKTIKDGFLPTFQVALKSTGGALGEFARQLAHGLNVKDFKENFKALAAGNVQAFGLMGHALSDVFRGFIGLARAAQPVFIDFLKWAQGITHAFAGKFEGEKNIQHMTDLIKHMGKDAAVIGHIFGATFGIIGNIFKAALPSGEALNGSLLDTLKHFQAWTGDPKGGQVRMRLFFERTAVLAKEVGRFVVDLVKEFLKLGEDKGKGKDGGIFKTFENARKALPPLREAIENFTEKTAPGIVKAITSIIKAFNSFAKSPAMTIIVGAIKAVAAAIQVVAKIFDIPVFGKIIGYTAGLVGLLAVLNKVWKMFGGKALTKTIRIVRADREDLPKGPMPRKFAFLRGLAGKDDTEYDDEGLPKKGSGVNSAGRRTRRGVGVAGRKLGSGIRGVGRGIGRGGRAALRRGRTPAVDEPPDDDFSDLPPPPDFDDESSPAPPPEGGRRRGRLRRRLGRGGGDRGSAGKKLLIGGAAAGAIGLALAPAIASGKIPGLDKAADIAGKLFTGDMNASMALGMLPMMGGAAKTLQKALNGPAGPLLQGAGSTAANKVGDSLTRGMGKAASSAGSALTKKIVPAMKGVASGAASLGSSVLKAGGNFLKMGIQAAGSAARVVASKVAMVAVSAATKAWAAVQWLLNAALDANPIGLVVIAIAALAAGIIYAYKHSETFRKIVDGALKGIQKGFEVLWGIVEPILGFFKHHLELLLIPFGPLGIAIALIITAFKHFTEIKKAVGEAISGIAGFFHDLPGKLLGFVKGIGDAAAGIGKAIWHGITSFLSDPLGAIANIGKAFFNGLAGLINKYLIDSINSHLHFKFDKGPIHVDFTLPGLPHIPLLTSGGGGSSSKSSIPVPAHGLAAGATVLPRVGGTLLRLAEAGKPESVVDTGLINARLRTSMSSDSRISAELTRQTELLRQIAEHAGFSIENFNLTANPGERTEQTVPRVLRDLAWQMGT